jgi:hypothetical protein
VELSDEVVDLMLRYYDSMRRGDADDLESALAEDVVLVGSDPHEWWSGRDEIVLTYRRQFESVGGGFPINAGAEPSGHAHGDVGWFADRPTISLPWVTVPFRLTAVTVRSGTEWKIAQMHFSVAVPNDQVFGRDVNA